MRKEAKQELVFVTERALKKLEDRINGLKQVRRDYLEKIESRTVDAGGGIGVEIKLPDNDDYLRRSLAKWDEEIKRLEPKRKLRLEALEWLKKQ
jgi:diaminopimelate decarboxylase